MANTLYPLLKTKLWQADLDLSAITMKAVLVDGDDYTYSAAHQFLSSVPAGARVSSAVALTGVAFGQTGSLSYFDANDVVLPAVTGDTSEVIIIYNDTPGAESAKDLIAYIDVFTVGAPVTPNGSDISVIWPAGGIATI